MRLVVLVLVVSSCMLSFDSSLLHRDAPTPDVPRADTAGDTQSDGTFCYGTFQTFCLDAAPSQPYDLTVSSSIDTGMTGMCTKIVSTAGVDVCVVAATTFTIESGATLTVHGPRALAVVATGAITIDGGLDVESSRMSGSTGPGANATSCAAPTPPDNGGGPGGSFRTAGGAGGAGATTTTAAAAALGSPTVLRGGCPGSVGGGNVAGTAGASGGALLLIGTSIVVRGHVNASGAGAGATAITARGGSGGGSGGMIVLDAPDVQVPAGGVVVALGGGGAEGSTTLAGMGGSDAAVSMPSTPPAGGSGGTVSGGDGGSGATGSGSGATPADGGTGGSSSFGGGGGGGAAGYIKCTDQTPTIGGSVYPPIG